jgi:hypothetical protein
MVRRPGTRQVASASSCEAPQSAGVVVGHVVQVVVALELAYEAALETVDDAPEDL